MKLVHVIPIARGITTTALSYFTTRDVPVGSVISVPLRKRNVPAVAASLENVADAKARLRAERFAVRKIGQMKAVPIFLPSFLKAAERTADYSATSVGAVLFATTSKAILEEPKGKAPNRTPSSVTEDNVQNQKLVLAASRAERFEQYRKLVRESFAKEKSIYLLAPTVQSAERMEQTLKRGIEKYTTLLHGTLSKKEISLRWENVLKESHPMLLIGTGSFLSIPRTDIETIIIENEGSPHYKLKTRPYIDMRVFAKHLSEEMHARLILADIPLRVESAYLSQIGILDEVTPLKARSLSEVRTRIIDMCGKSSQKEEARKTFTTISGELQTLVGNSMRRKEHIFLYTARRGLSPMTVCLDCGSPVVCDIRAVPLILYKGQKENIFVCHEHGISRSAKERCRNCGSWKLQSYGVGIELVADEMKKEFPDIPIHTIESKSTPSHKEAKKVAGTFHNENGAVLIGTEMALPYLEEVEASAVVSIDSLLSIPEWNAYERAFSILIRMRSFTRETMLIQTRKPDVELLTLAAEGNLADFYRNELNERKRFKYPPFFTLITISVTGGRTKVLKEMEEVQKKLADFEFLRQDNLIRKTPQTYTLQGFLRIERDAWPDDKLLSILRTLPAYVSVQVDPESIL